MFGWKKDKIKIKAVFRLQFQAIKVPKLKGKGLMLSIVPADVGKPTVRLRKTPIVEGTCSWETPIFETVKLIKDIKTGNFREKIYYFDVSTGSSKAGFLGGTAIDFADFAEASNALLVSLPLDDSESGPVLNITVERMHGNDNLRDLDANESRQSDLHVGSARNQMGDCDNVEFIQDDNVKAETSKEDDATNHSYNYMLPQKTTDVIPTEKNSLRRSNTDWSLGSKESSLMDSTNSQEERFPTDVPNDPIDLLKSEISKWERQAEISDMELQSLRKQIVKESKRGQELLQKIVILKEENEKLKSENSNALMLDEKNREIRHEKDLNRRLKSQLRRTEDSNSELVLAVKDLNKKLERKDSKIEDLDEEKETSLLKQKIEKMHSKIEVISKENEELKLECSNLSSELEENQLDHMNTQNEYHESLVRVKDLTIKLEKLEGKIKMQAVESLESLDRNNELEMHIKKLENEMDKQVQDFEDYMENEWQSKFENDKLNNDLRGQIMVLEDKLQKANEDLRFYEKEMWESEERDKELNLVKEKFEGKINVELCASSDFKDEKAEVVGTLQTEIKSMNVQYHELKQCSCKIELETENQRKQVSKLEGDLQKEEKVEPLKEKIASNEAKFNSILKKDIRSKSETHVNDDSNLKKLLSEVSILKNQNKDMEVELKEMQEKYLEVSLRFAEVEGERQHLVMMLRNLKNEKKK